MKSYRVHADVQHPLAKVNCGDLHKRFPPNFNLFGAKENKLEKSNASVVCDEADESGMNKLTIKGQSESRIFLIPRLNTIEAQKLNRVVSVPDQQIKAQWFREPTQKFALAAIPQDPALCPPMA